MKKIIFTAVFGILNSVTFGQDYKTLKIVNSNNDVIVLKTQITSKEETSDYFINRLSATIQSKEFTFEIDKVEEYQYYVPDAINGEFHYNKPTVKISFENNSLIFDMDSVNFMDIYNFAPIIQALAVKNIEINSNIYPNPANTILNISFESADPISISITTPNGQTVYQTYTNAFQQIDISNFIAGVYFVNVGGNVYKVVKE